MWGRISRNVSTTVVATAAAVVVVAGIGYAASGGFQSSRPTANQTRLYACVTNAFDTLNLTTAGATCPNGEQKISWNVVGSGGPRGARGRPGANGQRGIAGATGAPGTPGAAGAQGPAGPTGALGLQGPAGNQGPPGTPGTNGTNGAAGAAGVTGPTGATGAAGVTGPTGATGTLSSAYLDAYMSTNTSINAGGAWTFNTIQASSGITASGPNNTTFTVANGGTYLVTFEGATSSDTEPRVNNNVVGPIEPTSCNTAFFLCGFSRILSLSAGDAITLTNLSASTTVEGRGSGITIVRIA